MLIPLQIAHRSYAQNSKDIVLSPPTGKQLHIYNVKAYNGSASAIDVGILKRLNPDTVNFYQIDASETPDAVLANGIKSGTATGIFTTTDNDGFMVQCKNRFSLIGLNVSTASTGGTFTLQYYNGSAFTTLTPVAVVSAYAAGTQLILFSPPHDWVTGTTAAVGGESDRYSVLVRATTHPTNAVEADALWVADVLALENAVVAKGSVEFSGIPPVKPLILNGSEGIQPYFGGTASAANTIRIVYSTQE